MKRAVFSADGERVVTAGDDHSARVWEVPLARGMLAEWSALAERSPFVLVGSVHALRPRLTPRLARP